MSPENKIEDRTPMALLPYQQRWCADTSPVKLCEKSRRIGLSWGEAADTVLLAASANGMDSWYIGYNKDMAIEFIRDCANWAKFYGLAAGEIEETEEVFVEGDDKKSVLAFVIRFASPPSYCPWLRTTLRPRAGAGSGGNKAAAPQTREARPCKKAGNLPPA